MAEGWATLYTDASWKTPDEASWGIWLRADVPPLRVIRNGLCPPGTHDNHIAEVIAIIEGIQAARAAWPNLNGIGVRTDSQTAIHWYEAEKPHRREDVRAVQRRLWDAAEGLHVKLHWVKGHQKGGGGKAWLNRQVDGLARRARIRGCGADYYYDKGRIHPGAPPEEPEEPFFDDDLMALIDGII